jgi:hypothetical protein
MTGKNGSSFAARKRTSLATKAEECTAEQRRLKASAAAAREKAAKAPSKATRRAVKTTRW